MSDYTDIQEIELVGKKYILRALSGVVTESSQRSDTHVYGSGKQGNYSVNSSVSVTSQFWITTESGKEVNLQFGQDITARDGHVIHALYLIDPITRKDVGEYYVAAVNSSAETWWNLKNLIRFSSKLAPSFWSWVFRPAAVSIIAAMTWVTWTWYTENNSYKEYLSEHPNYNMDFYASPSWFGIAWHFIFNPWIIFGFIPISLFWWDVVTKQASADKATKQLEKLLPTVMPKLNDIAQRLKAARSN